MNRFSFNLFCLAILFCPCLVANAQSDGESLLIYDFDGDGVLGMGDVDVMTRAAAFGPDVTVTAETAKYDLIPDQILDACDIEEMVHLIGESMTPGKNLLTLSSCELGDFAFNGVVEQYDCDWFFGCFIFQASWGPGPGGWLGYYSHADVDGNGFVDQGDFDWLCNNWDWKLMPNGPTIPQCLAGQLVVNEPN